MKQLLACLLLVLATGAAADAPDRRAAQAWLAAYLGALARHDDAALAGLIDAQATVAVTLAQADDNEPPLRVTLTRAEFVQQQRALWRFASNDTRQAGPVTVATAADGSVLVETTLDEQHLLFGTRTGARHLLRIRLVAGEGVLRAAAIHSNTSTW